MKTNHIRELSYYIISEYYNNNLNPFFEYLDENIIWYGPAEGQIINSKKNMINALKKEKHQLKFAMTDVKDQIIHISKESCAVVLSYYIHTYYPNGINHVHNQNIDMTWIEKKVKNDNGKIIKKPFIIKMIISNVHSKHENDNIYPIHGETENLAQIKTSFSKRICLKSKNGIVYHVIPSHILWVENSDEGRHCIVYTTNGPIDCKEKTSNLFKQYNDLFFSPHISYLVNPMYIHKIERFKITLIDGSILPIAEKKFTKFKKDLKEFNLILH